VQEEEALLTSVTVRTTVWVPMWEQLKVLGLTVLLGMPQGTVEPASTSSAEMVAVPEALRAAV